MHPRIINERTRSALGRIQTSATLLADAADIPPMGLPTDRPANSEAGRMAELEAIAAFVERLAVRTATGPDGDPMFDALTAADWNALTQNRLSTLDALAMASDEEIDAVPGIGDKKRAAIRQTLQAMADSGQLAVILESSGRDIGTAGEDYTVEDGQYVDLREPATDAPADDVDHAGRSGGNDQESAREVERRAAAASLEDALARIAAQTAPAQPTDPTGDDDDDTEDEDGDPDGEPTSETDDTESATDADALLEDDDADTGADQEEDAPGTDTPADPPTTDPNVDNTVTEPTGPAPGPDATAPSGPGPGPDPAPARRPRRPRA